ncbi:MAG: PTS system fructose-specific EIIABC component [Elusimicrobia bacterium]|nr:PTS system fructose-specific EIIABC component [Elusimicrobiota bacterium]
MITETMKVLEFLDSASICLDIKSTSKQEAIAELCQILESNGKIKSADNVMVALMEREKLGSTGIGQGVAIPHGKTEATTTLVGALGISRKGIQFDSLDGEPVFVMFMLVAPNDSSGQHLKALARVSRLLKDKFFRQAVKEAKQTHEIEKIIREEDEY